MSQEEIKEYEGIEELKDEKILQYVLLNRRKSIEKREELRRFRRVIPGTNDVIFKNIMKNCPKYLSVILSHFIDCDKDILRKVIRLDNTELTVNNVMEARKTTDIIVRVFNKIINLEMNTSSYKLLVERNVSYLSKLKAEVFDRGEVYDKIYTVIQLNFDLEWKYDDREIVRFLLTDSDTGTVLTENYQIYNINLSKIKEKYYNKEKLSKFERAIALLTLEKISDLKEVSKGDEDLMEAEKEVERLSDNLGVLGVYDYWFHKEKEMKAIQREMEEQAKENINKMMKEAENKVQLAENKVKYAEEKFQEAEDKIQKAEYRVQEAEDKIQKAEYRVQEAEDKIQKAEYRVQEAEDKIQKAESKLKDTIKILLNKGLSINDIIDVTGLSKKEIEELKNP